ncbi:MAG: FAD-dependent oxidoreductase, partial [Dehalococcoidia bacterium]|nr:FAD-dependent oxidoreductase [Dehalococcoidia bacterium]
MPRTTEVAIVGGGVIGCSIAYQLAKRGITSTVFEQHRFASGASGATV